MSAIDPRAEDPVVALFALPDLDATRLVETNRRAVSAAFEAQGHGLAHMARIGGSVLDFVGRRLRRDAETAEALGACRTLPDAWLVYSGFVGTAIDDYAAQLGALAGLAADEARETLHDAEREVDLVVTPVLAETR